MQLRQMLAIGSALLLAACASPATRFHTLDPVPGSAAPGRTVTPPVQLDSVTIPPELDRPQIVRRAGPGRLDLADSDRWAGALDELARHALAADLAQRLGPGSTVRADDPAPPKIVRGLDVQIELFEGDPSGKVTLLAHWTLLGAAQLGREERIEVPAGTDIDATVNGMSQALGVLGDRIAAALSRT